MRKITVLILFVAVVLFFGFDSSADEGMWLLNNLPLKYLKEKYGFVPTPEWIEHVQKSVGRLPNCTKSFVSPTGLILTNGHCAEEAVQSLSTPNKNLYEKGFYAANNYAEELKTNLNVKILMSITDVTQRINDAVANEPSGDPARVRREAINRIQRNKVGLSTTDMLSVPSNLLNQDPFVCEVVILYQGGQYHNYCYRVYNDIRLVFAAEKNVWFFGGDADNFEYPRYTFDVAVLRAYENGKPARTPSHLKWPKAKARAKGGELLFVAGHPGRTARLLTSSALKTERDVRAPFLLDLFRRRELTTQQFMLRGKKEKMAAESDLFSWQNSRKLYVGKIRGLQDPKLVEEKESFEKELLLNPANSVVRAEFEEGLKLVKEAQSTIREVYVPFILLVRGLGFDSRLYDYAASVVSGNQNLAKAVLESRVGESPINLEYEEAKLRDSLTYLAEELGAESWVVSRIMQYGSGPSDIAHKLVNETKLSDVSEHQKLVQGGLQAVQQSNDPMIKLANLVKLHSEYYAKRLDGATEQERQGYAKISGAMFKIYGTDQYPDATFTLRLSFGTMSGYEENGKAILPYTTIGDAYDHSLEFDNQGDHKLPNRWWTRKKMVRLSTPLNFVSNLDITGGNSGSPVFNKDLEIVGLIFDSNIHGLVSDYDYDYSPQARAIAVHSASIVEILKNIYKADRLVKELTQ